MNVFSYKNNKIVAFDTTVWEMGDVFCYNNHTDRNLIPRAFLRSSTQTSFVHRGPTEPEANFSHLNTFTYRTPENTLSR